MAFFSAKGDIVDFYFCLFHHVKAELCYAIIAVKKASMCWVLHLSHNNPLQCYSPGEEWLGSCTAEKELGMWLRVD